jgi:hypothetical protein
MDDFFDHGRKVAQAGNRHRRDLVGQKRGVFASASQPYGVCDLGQRNASPIEIASHFLIRDSEAAAHARLLGKQFTHVSDVFLRLRLDRLFFVRPVAIRHLKLAIGAVAAHATLDQFVTRGLDLACAFAQGLRHLGHRDAHASRVPIGIQTQPGEELKGRIR